MKVKVEWQPEPGKWISQDCELLNSRAGNCYFKTSGTAYVLKDMKVGASVISKDNQGNWTQVGKVVHGGVFLGEGMPYSEYCQTEEGRKNLQEMLQGLQKWKVEA
jgi:hypothetical protein